MLSAPERCPNCDASVPRHERFCPTCSQDLGAPNVRECTTSDEREALQNRYENAQKQAGKTHCEDNFFSFCETIQNRSGVVVSMPASVARSFVTDPLAVYANYEALVGHTRRVASAADDRRRNTVVGALFGTYGQAIRYGVLSLTEEGLPTYGQMVCRLRRVAIEKRTSFMENNSYVFYDQHNVGKNNNIPLGYRSVWDNRHQLVMAKLGARLRSTFTEKQWQNLLVETDGKNRENDEFIEAHIFDSFNVDAVETMKQAQKTTLSREAAFDVAVALEQFAKRRTAGGGVT